jgi:hypothetical protein
VKAFFADLCCLSYLLFTKSSSRQPPRGPGPLVAEDRPQCRRLCRGTSGVGRSVNKVAGPATFTSQPHPVCAAHRQTAHRVPWPLREHADCRKTCPRRAVGTPPRRSPNSKRDSPKISFRGIRRQTPHLLKGTSRKCGPKQELGLEEWRGEPQS